MSLPPVALAVLVLDGCAWMLLLPAAWTAVRVLGAWDPRSSGAAQLALERRLEASGLLARLAVALTGLASLVLLVGLLVTLPRIVPGAMCAAGVLEALPGGRVMVALRLVTLLAAVVWARIEMLHRQAPLAPLALGQARALLVFVAIAAVASWRTVVALVGLDLDRTVSCCTILYDLAAAQPSVRLTAWLSGERAVLGTAISGLLVAGFAWRLRRRARQRARGQLGEPIGPLGCAGLGLVSAGWALLGSVALVEWTGPYLFGAIDHRCAWCLFLPIHGAYGFLAFGAIGLGLREAAGLITAEAVARSEPSLRQAVDRFEGGASLRLLVLSVLGLALVVGPALRWRLATGVDLFG